VPTAPVVRQMPMARLGALTLWPETNW